MWLERWTLKLRRILYITLPNANSPIGQPSIVLHCFKVMYQTGKTVYNHILKHQEENWKYHAQLSIFDELRGVCNFHQTVGASHSTKNSGLNFRKLSHVEGNGNFHQAGPILFRSRLSTFPAKTYSTKCWRIMIRGLSCVRKLLQESNYIRIHDYFSQTRPWYLPDRLKHHFRVMRETYEFFSREIMQTGRIPTENSERPVYNF